MPSPTIEDVETVFRGFADPTRIRILSVLAAGELCVCDIVDILGLPQPTVSRHLAYLRRSGLVDVRYAAKFAHYRLTTAANAVHEDLLDCVRSGFLGIAALDAERREAEARVIARAGASECVVPLARAARARRALTGERRARGGRPTPLSPSAARG